MEKEGDLEDSLQKKADFYSIASQHRFKKSDKAIDQVKETFTLKDKSKDENSPIMSWFKNAASSIIRINQENLLLLFLKAIIVRVLTLKNQQV